MTKDDHKSNGRPSTADVKLAFGGPEAAKLVGISYRQLDHWARKGLVLPSLTPASGSGSQRRYSYEDLLELKVIKSLRDAGVSLQRIEKAFKYIRDHLRTDPSNLRIMVDGAHLYAVRSDKEVIDLVNSGQVVIGFALGKIFEELDTSIAEIMPASGAAAASAPPRTGSLHGQRIAQ